MFNFFINNLLWHDGKYIALVTVLLIIFLVALKYILINKNIIRLLNVFIFILSCFFLFSLYFFRNPDRTCKERGFNNNILVSPCDGLVVTIEKNMDLHFTQKISVFLSPLDVHVNWIPDDGTIDKVIYRPGKFIFAFAPKSSDINERNDIIINCKKGKIQVGQIAGFIARRICCWVKDKEIVKAGQKFGMIRFGSRVDIFLPENVKIKVELGQKIIGGQTAIGNWIN